MTPEKRQRAEAIKSLIHMGWSPPPPSSEQTQRIIDDIVSFSSDGRHRIDLTEKETTVLSLLAEGHTRDSVAEQMHYSPETVKLYVKKILRKLGARNTAHAVAIAYRAGELELRRAA